MAAAAAAVLWSCATLVDAAPGSGREFGNPVSLLIPIGIVVLAYVLARPTSRTAGPLRRSFRRVQLLRPGLIAVLVMWVIGFALNDSGTAIPAVGAALAIPPV